MLHFPRYTAVSNVWIFKGARTIRTLKQVTHRDITVYINLRIYHRYHAGLIDLSFPFVHPCHDTFNYIAEHKQVSAILHFRLSDDGWTAKREISFPEIEIMDSENTVSLNGEDAALKVLSCVEITCFFNIQSSL